MNVSDVILRNNDFYICSDTVSFDNDSVYLETLPSSEDRQRIDGVVDDNTTVSDSDMRDGDVGSVDLQTIIDNQEVITEQLFTLNENLVTLQEDNKFTIGLLFAVCVALMVTFSFKILYKLLGLGQM